MILISENLKLVAKTKRQGEKNGKPWTSNDLSFEDHGIITTLPFIPQRIYDKAEENKIYLAKFYISPQGKVSINDIELCK